MNAEQLLARMAGQVDRLVRLVAVGLVEGRTKREKMLLLAAAGMSPKEIADLIGSTRNAVSVELHRARKRGDMVGETTSEEHQ